MNTVEQGTFDELPAPGDAAAFIVTAPADLAGVYLSDGMAWAKQSSGGGSQPFTPTDLDDLGLWLDASELPAGTLASWADASPSGYDAAQATGGNRPTVVAAVRNGLNVVRFAAGKFMEFTGDALGLTAGVGGITIAFMAKSALDESPVFIATMEGDATQVRFGASRNPNGHSNFFTLGGSSTNEDDIPTWYPFLGSYVVDEGSEPDTGLSFVTGGAQGDGGFNTTVGTSPVSASPSAAMWLGKDPWDDAASLDLGELLVYRRALNAAERRQVLEYLSAKWATL